jgi:isoleucyl-tRNA synthetase
VTVVGSKAELAERATGGMEQLEELHRPWVDRVTIRCDACGAEDVRRVPEVGDVWLDAGIVPFSTLGWENPEWVSGGYATGASAGLSGADLPDHAYWERWFPADWVSEMREQIRLWFYSLLFMSVVLTRKAPYRRVLTYEKLLDAEGREMHGSWGNLIDAEDAFEHMGADVMRWLYSAQPPTQNIRFGYGPAHEVKRKLLTLWNSVVFLVTYADVEGFAPRYSDLERGPSAEGELRPLDRWLLARTQALVEEATAALEGETTAHLVRGFEAFVDDLSNWYIRRSRRRFYSYDDAAFRTLWYALVQALRVIGPVTPFLADHLWRRLVAEPCDEAPESAFLAGWPELVEQLRDDGLLEEMAEVRRVVELGRAARAEASLKLRQPLRRLVVDGAERAERFAEEIADELRVKEVGFGGVENVYVRRAKPNLPALGSRGLGKAIPEISRALAANEVEQRNGKLLVAGHELDHDDVFWEYAAEEGWQVAADDGVVVGLDTRLDPELEVEGRVLDLIHAVQRLRKDSGLEITDRIVLTVPERERPLLEHADWIKGETLATAIDVGPDLAIAKA